MYYHHCPIQESVCIAEDNTQSLKISFSWPLIRSLISIIGQDIQIQGMKLYKIGGEHIISKDYD